MAGLLKKACYMNKDCKNHLKFQISNLQIDSRFKLIHSNSQYYPDEYKTSGKRGVYIHLFPPKKNSNNSNMTQWSIKLLSKNDN